MNVSNNELNDRAKIKNLLDIIKKDKNILIVFKKNYMMKKNN